MTGNDAYYPRSPPDSELALVQQELQSKLLVIDQLRVALDSATQRARMLEQAVKEAEGARPTQWAYEQACKALEKQRKRADAEWNAAIEAAAKVVDEGLGVWRRSGVVTFQQMASDIRALERP